MGHVMFSSPHGDFSFSINKCFVSLYSVHVFSSPHGDFSFSIHVLPYLHFLFVCFRPLTGISLFLYNTWGNDVRESVKFSSPHGDFSFSILSHIPLINQGLFL